MPDTFSQRSVCEHPLRVLVVTGIYPTTQKPHLGTFIKSQVDALRVAGIEVEVIHPGPGPVLFRYFNALLQVFFKTLTGHFDLVHGHYGLWCLIGRLQWRVPVIAAFLGDDLLGTITPGGGYSKKGAFVVYISRWLSRHVDAVIVKSAEMRAKVPRDDNVHILPNGVDFAFFRPLSRSQVRAELGWKQDGYYVLFGNNPQIPVKNYVLAEVAIQLLQAQGFAVELIVANGLPQTSVVQYINASNVLLLTSLAEGSPNIVKEAMACNLPVVSTNVGDVSQIIGNTSGCFICPHDASVLAKKLACALQENKPTTGRYDIRHLDNTLVAQQFIEVYREVTDRQLNKQRSQFTLDGPHIPDTPNKSTHAGRKSSRSC